jgi:hypothetical protein
VAVAAPVAAASTVVLKPVSMVRIRMALQIIQTIFLLLLFIICSIKVFDKPII